MPKAKKRYEYKLNLGKHPVTGETIRKSFYSTKSLKDAKRKAEDYRLHYEMELCVTGSSVIKSEKFSTWALSCLETHKKPYVKPNTYSGTYLEPVQRHLIPYFGKMDMDDIKPIHVQTYLNQAAQKYAPETVKKDYNCLKLIFDTAVDNQLCAKSPITKSIKLPQYKTVRDKHAFTQEQYDIVYSAAKEAENGLPLMLMLETGVSRSELLGLRWDDIDTEGRSICITQGLVVYHDADADKQVLSSDGLKNKFRKRIVPITDEDLWTRYHRHPAPSRLAKGRFPPLTSSTAPRASPITRTTGRTGSIIPSCTG